MSIDLSEKGDLRHIDDANEDGTRQLLPPTDAGPAAWKYLFGSTVIEAVLWGFLLSFGVFQEHYSKQPEFKNNKHIPIIGTLSTCVYYLGGLVLSPLTKRFQRWQRHLVVAGSITCALSLLAASYANSVGQLIATQGFLYGIGFAMLYFPVMRMLDEWFVRRRGLAYGLLNAGGGLSGAVLPFLLEALLSRHGHRTTLRVACVAQCILVAPILPLIRGRLPTASTRTRAAADWSFFRQPLFWCFALSNFLQGLGCYIPALFLPTFASDMGLSDLMGALLLAAHNLASVMGLISFGYLSDHVENVLILVFSSSFLAATAAFVIWGLARSLGSLVAFAFVYGWSAGAFPVFWQRFGSTLSHDPQPVLSLMIFGKGVGNIAIPPIAEALTTQPVGLGYGLGKYQALTLFLGASMFCSSLGILGWPLKRR